MRRVALVILGASTALGTACASSTAPTATVTGTWQLNINLQSTPDVTCPDDIFVMVTLTQVGDHTFKGTYAATPAACVGATDTIQIVRAAGDVRSYGTVIDSTIAFSLDTQGPPAFGGSFTGAFPATFGTVQFSRSSPAIVVNGTWGMVEGPVVAVGASGR